jgi:hypothetical protein
VAKGMAPADLLVPLLRPLAALIERLIEDREPHEMARQVTQQRTVGEQGNAQQQWEDCQRQLAFSHVKKRQEERIDVVEVALGFNYECGAMGNRVGNRMSSTGGDTGEEGGRNANHLISQFLIAIQKCYIDKISRTDGAAAKRN